MSVDSIIHLSDLHFGARSSAEFLALHSALVKEISKHPKQKYLLVITGDVVDDGSKSQYYAARQFFEDLVKALPVLKESILFCPGNHDYGWNGIFASPSNIRRFNAHFAKFLPGPSHGDQELLDFPIIHSFPGHRDLSASVHLNPRKEDTKPYQKLYFIGLDSMQAELGIDRIGAEGELGERQLEELKRLLDNIAHHPHFDKDLSKIIVYLHHDPWDQNGPLLRLKDREKFLDLLKTSQVNMLLCGHSHSRYVKKLDTAASWAFAICADSTTASRHFRVWNLAGPAATEKTITY